jgi:hypothetical protein
VAFRSNPWVQKVVAAGEAQLDRLTSQFLGNERFVAAVQTAVSRTLAAKGTMDKSIRAVLATMNLPSVQDIDDLRSRLDELDRSIGELAAKLAEVEKGISAPAPKAPRPRAKASASGDKTAEAKKAPVKKKA